MIQELNRFQCLRTYKKVRITFLKDETNDYIENLQMLIFFEGFEKPVYATKLNAFEFYETVIYESERKWANIPFIQGDVTKKTVNRIRLKDGDYAKLSKFLSRFNLRTINLVTGEVFHNLRKLDAESFSNKPKKAVREKVQVFIP